MEFNDSPHDRSNPGRRFSLFDDDGNPLVGNEMLGTLGAEEAICFQLLRENDSFSRPLAQQLAADFIRNGRNLRIVVSVNGRERHYVGGDPVLGRRPLYFGCL